MTSFQTTCVRQARATESKETKLDLANRDRRDRKNLELQVVQQTCNGKAVGGWAQKWLDHVRASTRLKHRKTVIQKARRRGRKPDPKNESKKSGPQPEVR